MHPSELTPERVREFLLSRYAIPIRRKTGSSDNILDSFNFLTEGIVDSYGVLELVMEVEKEFGMELDLSGLRVEEITVLGPFSRYVSAQANTRRTQDSLIRPTIGGEGTPSIPRTEILHDAPTVLPSTYKNETPS